MVYYGVSSVETKQHPREMLDTLEIVREKKMENVRGGGGRRTRLDVHRPSACKKCTIAGRGLGL